MVPILKTTLRDIIMNYVRKNKDMTFFRNKKILFGSPTLGGCELRSSEEQQADDFG